MISVPVVERNDTDTGWIITYRSRCEECTGTGIYVGLAERDGAGVICAYCHGTGLVTKAVRAFDVPDHKPTRDGVVRVYRANPGIVIGCKPGECELGDFGGIPYEDWCAGREFEPGTEDRAHTCPAWFYQTADYSKKPKWEKCMGCGMFSQCHHFGRKHVCWEQWDAEFSSAATTD